MRKIAIDAMGGENAPEAIVEAVLKAKPELPEDKFIFFGDEGKLKELLPAGDDQIEIVATTEVILDEDEPVKAMRTMEESFFKYKQWNAAFDAGYCAALGTPYVTLHDADIIHPLKEVDAEAKAWCQTTDQVVETLKYILRD